MINMFCRKISVIIFISLFMFSFSYMQAWGAEKAQIKKNQVLSIQDCVAFAINNSPVIKKYEYNLEIANSNVGIAKSVYFPTLGAGVGIYQDYNSNKNYDGSSNRELPSAAVTFNQLIWNFGKASSMIKMEQFYRLGAEYQFMDSICNTIYDVKSKYYAVLRAQGEVEIAKNNVLINEKNYERAKKYAKSGKRTKIDVVNAEVYLSDAKIALVDARNEYDNALADLGNSLFVAYAPDFKIKEVETFRFRDDYQAQVIEKGGAESSRIVDVAFRTGVEKNILSSELKKLPFNLEQAIELAYKSSPDLWVLESTLKAMQQSVLYIKRQYYPDLTGNIGYGYNNTKDLSNNNLNMSVNLTSSLNIKQLKHEIDRAMAEVNLASNDIDHFRQNLYFSVKKAYINVDKNSRQIPAAQEKVRQALENFELADKLYDEGKRDYILWQNARENYNEAKIEYVDTLYHYNMSLADLEIAMHYHLDDLHSQAEHAMHYHHKEIIEKLEESLHCQREHHEHPNHEHGEDDPKH